MDPLDLERLRAAAVAHDPFDHILLPNFIPPETLPAVVAALPPMRGRGSFPIGALRLDPPAQALVSMLEGPAFRAIIADQFQLDLADAPTMTTLRGNSGAKDGQIHTDSAVKRVTILLYLNPSAAAWSRQEGCLRLLRDGTDLENYAVEVPPIDGALLAFPNTPHSFHGHKTFIGQRYVIQMNYMTTGAKAQAELRRHHLSAFIKKLTRAA